jgi:hypothetical protein
VLLGPEKSSGSLPYGSGFAPDFLGDMVFIIVVFLVSTGAGALVCLYYELPLVLSQIGVLFVLGIALAYRSNSIFDL